MGKSQIHWTEGKWRLWGLHAGSSSKQYIRWNLHVNFDRTTEFKPG